jgi:glucan 1,3-beta-glucosidase
MVCNPATFTALLKALQLTFKPVPGASFISVNNSAPYPVSTSLAIVPTSLPIRHTPLDGRYMQEDSCYVEPYVISPIIETFGPFDQDTATIMRYRRQQSVNLGSWYTKRLIQSHPRMTDAKKIGS